MSGVTLWRWIETLWRHRASIDFVRFAPRLALVTTLSVFNALGAIGDGALWAFGWRKTRVRDDPVFIVGRDGEGFGTVRRGEDVRRRISERIFVEWIHDADARGVDGHHETDG